MISVDVPKEIREYKERLVFGLTIRQLIAVIIALGTCVPLYLYGRKYINDEVLSWLIILIAIPCVAVGFFRKNGMPFEKYIYAVVKHQLLMPQTTVYKTGNFFREKQQLAEKAELHGIKKGQIRRYRTQATLERAYLMEEAEKQGNPIDMEKIDEDLLTVRKPQSKNGDDPKKDKHEDKEKKEKKSKAQIIAEEVEAKKEKDPYYIPTAKEGRMILAYANELKKKRVGEIKEGKKKVAKKNQKMNKRKKAKTFIPKSTQDDLPVRRQILVATNRTLFYPPELK